MKLVYAPLLLAGLAACTSTTGSVTDATTAVADPNPTVVNSIAAMDLDNLAVGEGVKIEGTAGLAAKANGSVITKLQDNTDGSAVYLSNLQVTENGTTTQKREIVFSPDLAASLQATDAQITSGVSNLGQYNVILPTAQLGASSSKYGAVWNSFDGARSVFVLYVNDANGDEEMAAVDLRYRSAGAGSAVTARQTIANSTDINFTAPSGQFTLSGAALIGVPNGLVSGAATMDVDFASGTGSVAAPNLSDYQGGSSTGALEATFDINSSTGTFVGTANGTVDNVTKSGQITGVFNGDATLATAVADMNGGDWTGMVAVAR